MSENKLSALEDLLSDDRSIESCSDSVLANAITEGDRAAWGQFFERFARWAYRFAYYHLSRNRADAEDLCSDIMMTAASSIGSYDADRGTLDVWVLGIARNRLARFCRCRHVECAPIGDAAADQKCDSYDLIDKVVLQDEVNRALSGLPERQASVLIQKYIEGYSVEEIARIEGTTAKAVESLLTRARDSFKAALSDFPNVSKGGV